MQPARTQRPKRATESLAIVPLWETAPRKCVQSATSSTVLSVRLHSAGSLSFRAHSRRRGVGLVRPIEKASGLRSTIRFPLRNPSAVSQASADSRACRRSYTVLWSLADWRYAGTALLLRKALTPIPHGRGTRRRAGLRVRGRRQGRGGYGGGGCGDMEPPRRRGWPGPPGSPTTSTAAPAAPASTTRTAESFPSTSRRASRSRSPIPYPPPL